MSASNVFVRVNGRGNAWPVFLGGNSKFYNSQNSEDLSSASFSIIQSRSNNLISTEIEWEVLIDAGHHTVPFLIKNGNRIPNAVVLTHGHMDHTLGLDWVAQSCFYLSDKKKFLSVYATQQVWQFVKQSYPHLEKIIDFKELLPGETKKIEEIKELQVTAYPVYHGEHAKGASMLFFETSNKKSVVFTGDMLCPLLRKKDYDKIRSASAVFIDSNNRFPYPKSNHGSIVANGNNTNQLSNELTEWFDRVKLKDLIKVHSRIGNDVSYYEYFREFLADFNTISYLPHTVFGFAQKSRIPKIYLIHYGGMEDMKHHNASDLSTAELQKWVNHEATKHELGNIKFIVPNTGDVLSL